MFFVVFLLFLVLICFYYVYCTILSLGVVLLHVCTWLVGPAVALSRYYIIIIISSPPNVKSHFT